MEVPGRGKKRAAAAAVASAWTGASKQNPKQQSEKEQQQGEQPSHASAAAAATTAAGVTIQGAPCAPPTAKRSRPRKVVDEPGDAVAEQSENAYERQRTERMAHNRRVLQEMGVQDAAQQMQRTANVPACKSSRRVQKQEAAEGCPPPARQSARLRAAAVAEPEAGKQPEGDGDAIEQGGGDYQEELLTQEQYFAALGQPLTGFKVDGEYHGWVCPAVCERYGIASSASAAWESNGGGAFKRTISKADVPAQLKARGWSDARAFSSTQLLKNPNTYFYRHVAPHEQQAQGEWTEAEHELFLATAKQKGAGTKWGLFASHIPQRVGYQCSAYYRDVMIPRGLIVDARFRLTKGGRAVYVGPAGSARAGS